MTSTFGSLGESLVESLAADPTISSLISEAQERGFVVTDRVADRESLEDVFV